MTLKPAVEMTEIALAAIDAKRAAQDAARKKHEEELLAQAKEQFPGYLEALARQIQVAAVEGGRAVVFSVGTTDILSELIAKMLRDKVTELGYYTKYYVEEFDNPGRGYAVEVSW